MMIGRGCFRFLRDGKHDAAEPLVKGPTAPMYDLPQTEQECKAGLAFLANAAMLRAQSIDPSLMENPYWIAAREYSLARFMAEFENLP